MLACSASTSEDCQIPPEGLPNVFRVIVPHYPDITQLLQYTDGAIGAQRIQLTYMVLSLVLSNYTCVYECIVEYKMLEMIIDAFFSYRHNCTIFRQVVCDIINCIVKRPIEMLRRHLLDHGFVRRLVDEFNKSNDFLFGPHALTFSLEKGYHADHHAILVVLMTSVYNIDDSQVDDTFFRLHLPDSRADEFYLPFFDTTVLPQEAVESRYFPGRSRSISPSAPPDNDVEYDYDEDHFLNA